jgi:predicted metal-dependent hydrolase
MEKIMIEIKLGDIAVSIIQKNIKNIHLSVCPPLGTVRISAPLWMKPDNIRLFAISKLGWIKQQRHKLQNQARELPKECIDRESHYLWGKRYLLQIVECNAPPQVEFQHHKILLQIRPKTSQGKKQTILDTAYRQQLKAAIPPLIAKWEKLMGVTVTSFAVRKMKTRWGSCSPKSQTIRLNLELAKKPVECLEYVIVHELAHLLEPTHDQRFVALLDRFMPKWRSYQAELNQLPLAQPPGKEIGYGDSNVESRSS